MSNHLATAHEAWDARWRAGGEGWREPEPEVNDVVAHLHERGVRRALDLGCGVGRHTFLLAEAGFAVTAVDASEAAIGAVEREAARRGLDIEVREGPFHDLPDADATYDYVLAWNVVYHGDGDVARQALAEIARVLRPGGLYQGTMLSKRHTLFGQGEEVRPDTFVIPGDAVDKAHPHFYCDRTELFELHRGTSWELAPVEVSEAEHGEPGSWHWHVVAERR